MFEWESSNEDVHFLLTITNHCLFIFSSIPWSMSVTRTMATRQKVAQREVYVSRQKTQNSQNIGLQ